MPESTVLVVDDDPVILKLLEVNFEMEGFTVLLAHDGAEGIEVARREHPDIIVSDIMMPTTSGLELVSELKGDPRPARSRSSCCRRRRRTPTCAPGIDAGADDYITKPFDPLDLVDRVNGLLSERASKGSG